MTPIPGDPVGADGLLPGARQVRSPNQDERPAGAEISLIVIHAISLPPGRFGGDGIERLFTNRLDSEAHPYYRTIAGLQVSAHFLIRREGEVIQFVPCHRRAWHAGASCFRGRDKCNDYSIGIELEGCDELPFDDRQYGQLALLLRVLGRSYAITDMVGHADIAPGRKSDPGPYFDWRRMRTMTAV